MFLQRHPTLFCVALALSVGAAMTLGQAPKKQTSLKSPGQLERDPFYEKREAFGRSLVPFLGECMTTSSFGDLELHKRVTVWERDKGKADGLPYKLGGDISEDYGGLLSVVVVVDERRSGSQGSYLYGQPAYDSTFDFCVVDLPTKKIVAKGSRIVRAPSSINSLEGLFEVNRRNLEQWIMARPRKPDSVKQSATPNQ